MQKYKNVGNTNHRHLSPLVGERRRRARCEWFVLYMPKILHLHTHKHSRLLSTCQVTCVIRGYNASNFIIGSTIIHMHLQMIFDVAGDGARAVVSVVFVIVVHRRWYCFRPPHPFAIFALRISHLILYRRLHSSV